MIPKRLLFGALFTITALAAIGISGHTTVQEAAAAETTASMMACLCNSCDGDVTSESGPFFCDGEVDVLDLLKVLQDHGKVCGVDIGPLADADRDGDVDDDDITTVQNNWGSCP